MPLVLLNTNNSGQLSLTNTSNLGRLLGSISSPSAPAPAGTVYTTATTTGGVSITTTSPFSGGGNSYLLNGSTGYLSLPGDLSWAVGTGDFTIEWFQYQTDNNSFPRIFGIGSYPTQTIQCSIEGGTFYAWVSGANSFGTLTGYKNSWQHFAIVRRSSQLYVYRNGTQISTAKANTSNITNSSTTLYLGVENGGNARGVNIDLSKAPIGASGDLIWKVSGKVNSGSFVQLDNVKVGPTRSGAGGGCALGGKELYP